MIIYNFLFKITYNLSIPHEWGTPELEDNYAHVIDGPGECTQGKV